MAPPATGKKKFGWGGARPGAGRPRIHPLPTGWHPEARFVPHLRRVEIDAATPVHVALRLVRLVRTLRTARLHRVIHGALLAVAGGELIRVVHYSIQADHIHLIVEADDGEALARGLQGLSIRIARAINAALGRTGTVFADRYHATPLRDATEARRALLHVLNNARHHADEKGAKLPPTWIDPLSSAPHFDGWSRAVRVGREAPVLPRCTAAPRSAVLRSGWRRAGGALDPAELPEGAAPDAFGPADR